LNLSDEDLNILIETGDADKDGKISLSDFRQMLDGSAPSAANAAGPAPASAPLRNASASVEEGKEEENETPVTNAEAEKGDESGK
jgi:Ca2+-binding EF-hand superfamily protein